MATPTIPSQRLTIIPVPFDAKRSNCFISGADFIIETIPEYLLRVPEDIRDVHVVSVLVPKSGYTSLSPYPIATISSVLANYDTKLYSFREGLGDANFLEIASQPYIKEYHFIASQSGAFAPVITELLNELGTITPARTAMGTYTLTSSGLFTSGKTVFINDLVQDPLGNLYVFTWLDVNTIEIKTYDAVDISSLADNVLTNRYFTIKVFI